MAGMLDSVKGAAAKAGASVKPLVNKANSAAERWMNVTPDREAAKMVRTKTVILGNSDSRISDVHKIWISDGQRTICGVYGKGTSEQLAANWQMPFSDLQPGNSHPVIQGALEASGRELTTVANTLQTWKGDQPPALTIELLLYALSDAESEVMKPLRALQEFMAPDVDALWNGDIFNAKAKPAKSRLQILIGRKVIYQHFILKSITIPHGSTERDSSGNYVRCTVNLEVESISMISLSNYKKGQGIQTTIPELRNIAQ